MKNIKPCPFCKGEGACKEEEKGYESYRPYFLYYVECSTCHAMSNKFLSPETAIDAWNLRRRRKDAENV